MQAAREVVCLSALDGGAGVAYKYAYHAAATAAWRKPMKRLRVVVKVGSSSLVGPGGGVDAGRLGLVAHEAASLRASGAEVVLVSSGAVAAGLGALGLRPGGVTLAERQAAAAVGQGRLVDAYREAFLPLGVEVAQVLLSRAELEHPSRVRHLRAALGALLRHGAMPIVNENDTVAADEVKIGDNDTLAAILAVVAGADLLVLLTDIDGFYDQDPRRVSGARRIDVVEAWTPELQAAAGRPGSGVGTGGMRTKLSAARIASAAGVDTVIARTAQGVLKRVLEGEGVGTRFRAHPDPGPRHQVWLRYGARPRGRLILDDGAAEAVQERQASLLLPGIKDCRGAFQAGDVVELATTADRVIARGTAMLGAQDLMRWLARQDRPAGRAVRVVQHRTMVMAGREPGDGLEQG